MENGVIMVILTGGFTLVAVAISLSVLALFQIVDIKNTALQLFKGHGKTRKSSHRSKRQKKETASETGTKSKESETQNEEESWETIFTVAPLREPILPEPLHPHDTTLLRPCQRLMNYYDVD